MLNLSQPKRSPILLNYVFLLDGGIVLRRFVAFRASTARRRAEAYQQNLVNATSQSPPIPHRQGRSRCCSAHRIGRLRRRRS
jgi:hypothetical protein